MKAYLFSDEEKLHLKFIRDNSPIRIWNEYIQYVFEYKNFYFILKAKLAEKVCQEDESLFQFAMTTEMKFVDEKFVVQDGCELLCENEPISDVEIVRTKLYFTKYYKLKENYYRTDSGQINPEMDLPKNIEINEIIIVDAGIGIKLENKRILNLFINENDDDFTSADFYFREGDYQEELGLKYQFIALS